MTNQEITKYVADWFARADEDLDVAQLILEEERPYNPACFHAQQAAEKYLKGFLAHHEKHTRKIHDLNALLQECIKIDQSFEDLQDSARHLSRFYVESRYPDDYVEFTREDAENGFEAALRMKSFVLEKIKSKQKSGFGIVRLIFLVAVTILLFGGGLFVYQYFSGGIACTQEAIRCPGGSIVGRTGLFCRAQCPGKSKEPSLKVQEINTTNWKTYRNEKYGFEVRYPKEYKIYQENRGISIRPIDGSYPYPFIKVSDLALQAEIENTVDKVITDEEIERSGVAGRKIIEEMVIGGHGLNYFFSHNNNTYLLRGTNTEVNQIMFSTFKFTR